MSHGINKANLTETDIITKLVLPAVKSVGWDDMTQIRQELPITDGKVVVRGQMAARLKARRADIVLFYKDGMPLAVIEAKANKYPIGHGIQQALSYAEMLSVPFVFSTNGDGFLFHDKTNPHQIETQIELEDFPSCEQLWQKYVGWKGYQAHQLPLVTQSYHNDGEGKAPRYYQMQAINQTIEAVSKGQNRLLLVMATGTGKTYTAFQIIWRLWKAKAKKRILFLADRTALIEQTHIGDFQPFDTNMTIIKGHKIDPAYQIYLGLYQGITGKEEIQKAYKNVSEDFFDLIVIDECHRGSADENSAWREILDHFSGATQIGLTATPKETEEVSNIEYFGEPIYTYSLKQGIEDGFLAPYKVIRVDIDKDVQGWRPEKNQVDKHGNLIEDRIYNQKDFDRTLVIDERTELVAKTITNYLKRTDPMAKTIVFCNDIDHARRMRDALVKLNPEQMAKNDKYIMRITGDEKEGKDQLGNFTNPKKPYPVIATTSELMTTGVDAKTCKLIVLDQTIQSMTKFKQIIGRGTRIDDKFGKLWFTILDFKKATELFADPRFDGDPEQVKVVSALDFEDDTSLDNVIEGDEASGFTDADMIDPDTIQEPDSGYQHDGAEAWHTSDFNLNNEDNHDPDKIQKFHVQGVSVEIFAKRVQYYGSDGKLVTESFKDYTRKTVSKQFASLDEFVKKWQDADKKQAIIDELEEQGVIWSLLEQEVGKELDPFDMICHIVYDQPPLTRKERANNVKKRNYFTKYDGVAQEVLSRLLDKYADEGVSEIENIQVLKVAPFDQIGRMREIIKKGFNDDKEQYYDAVKALEDELYQPHIA
ncbi:EcoAI/FtnUII family type I restriction enzme subunit R [Marinomonas gallaica]|uniref:EcoAI/FtnUII family type I restriction enzme subunit R n=1 Tax=Marinomonas gallaica TaxID=1806667 RepID=UPI003CE4B43C